MKKVMQIFAILVIGVMVFSNCKKDKKQDETCGLIGTWVYESDVEYAEVEFDGSSLTFSDTYLDSNGEIVSEFYEHSYTVNESCSQMTFNGQTVGFSVDGNSLTALGFTFIKE